MGPAKAALSDKLEAIIDLTIAKYKNPNKNVTGDLNGKGISARELYYHIGHFGQLINHSSGARKRKLESIAKDPDYQSRVFRMDFDFLGYQLKESRKNKEFKFATGTFENIGNIEDLIYIGITTHSPKALTDRGAAINVLRKIQEEQAKYAKAVGIDGVFTAYTRKRGHEPLSLLHLFDRARQRITQDKSIFDLSQEYHLHEWVGLKNSPPYLTNPANARIAAYHLLGEDFPKLKLNSAYRKEVVEGLKRLLRSTKFEDLEKRLIKKGLGPLLKFGYQGTTSLLGILMAFDAQYQSVTGDKSLFDLSRKHHIHPWLDGKKTPGGYWKNEDNRMKANYHLLTERDPRWGSPDNETVISAISELPPDRKGYMLDTITSSLAAELKNSPLYILEQFDHERRDRFRVPSIFDLDEQHHLHKWDYSKRHLDDPHNFNEAVTHLARENQPALLSCDRKTLLEAIANLEGGVSGFFRSFGLSPINRSKAKLTRKIIDVLNRAHIVNGGISLYSLSSPSYTQYDNCDRLRVVM